MPDDKKNGFNFWTSNGLSSCIMAKSCDVFKRLVYVGSQRGGLVVIETAEQHRKIHIANPN
ncbi:hypothetical protein SADUNF_Sadunf18G0100300 [Salix dunnii]|uniref:Uncharacterized protein n=1 Tax=Salix dunnii TaxID=1413687 RepID=A0A835J3L4_9ROSI|nr:hypothetical protein SADUNF_Sadunf18G0100300 [Salix dunnii]